MAADPIFAMPKVSFGFRRGFLNRPAMVVLVPRQCCTAGKRFLTVGVGTFVWAFARVDSSVPG